MIESRVPAYRPIKDYALIGDCHGAALVASDGSIDWAALHRFDADPVCCRVLDAQRGGHWSMRPQGDYKSQRAYLPGTNMLRTVFTTSQGCIAITDFMPVGRRLKARTHDYVRLNAPGWIVRRAEVLQGDVKLAIEYRPSKAFAREVVELMFGDGALQAGVEMPALYCSSEVDYTLTGDMASASLQLTGGQRCDFVLADSTVEGQPPCQRVEEFFEVTRSFWQEWIAYCRYRGPYREAVERSALALKLLTYAPSGAMVAAATTSLPEEIGGERNWDYRFCWVRDASFALYALAVLGYSGEARCFHDFLLNACKRSLPLVRPMYAIDGALKLDELTLDHLEGYRQSAPVRSGNGAYLQRQIDSYGQMLDLAQLYHALGGRLDAQYRRLLDAVARFIAAHWHEPDQGLWEMRGPPRHHVHGKLMSWAGMDRAGRLLDAKWSAVAQRIEAEIRAHASAADNGRLRQAYDGGTDVAVLLAPMLGFALPEPVLKSTIAHVIDELQSDGFLARYQGDDGVAGGEGHFLVCTSWLADAQLAAGQIDAARAAIDKLAGCANDVGLYAEEIDASNGEFLGNFPQALTHLGLIANAANLQLVERGGTSALEGSYADRARRAVRATFGWRGVVAAMRQSSRVTRIFSSSKSKLAWP